MKRILVLFFLCISFHITLLSQQHFEVGFSTGIASPIYSPQVIGLASFVTFSYKPVGNIGIYLSSGRIEFGSGSDNFITNRLTPFILGVKYYYKMGNFHPNISFEIEGIYSLRNIRKFDWVWNGDGFDTTNHRYDDTSPQKIFGWSPALGLGIAYEATQNINFELQIVVILTTTVEAASTGHGRFMVGFNYLF